MKVKGMSIVFLFVTACGQQVGSNNSRFVAADAIAYNSAEALKILPEESTLLASAVSLENIQQTSTITASEGILKSTSDLDKVAVETQAPAPQTQAPAPQTQAPAPQTQAPAPQTQAPAPQTQAPAPQTQAPAPQTQAPAPQPKAPEPYVSKLPDSVKSKLAACYSQWDKLSSLKDTEFLVREYNVDVARLRKTTIELGGNQPEVVFLNISSDTRIAKVNIGLMNPKALYCVDINAGRVINKLSVFNKCGSMVGVLDIDAGRRARNIEVREICQ